MRRGALIAMLGVIIVAAPTMLVLSATGTTVHTIAWVALGLLMIVTYLTSTWWWLVREKET